jgi:hypothetical protein
MRRFAFSKKLVMASLMSLLLAGLVATATLADEEAPQCKGLHTAHHQIHHDNRDANAEAEARLHELLTKYNCHHPPE